ncbi:MAG: sulfurtransferase TusA family protein [Bacilli bacterium]
MKKHLQVDAKGLACPMPIVRTKKAIETLNEGETLELLATDKGSTADVKAWAERTGHSYLGTDENDGILKHYIRKGNASCQQPVIPEVTNEQLRALLQQKEIQLIDVRESEEYVDFHITEAINIPLGNVSEQLYRIDRSQPAYIICRSGRRSELAAQQLKDAGICEVYNVVPGMQTWM